MIGRWLSCLLLAQTLAAGITLPVGATQPGGGNTGGQSNQSGGRDALGEDDERRLDFIPIVTEDGLNFKIRQVIIIQGLRAFDLSMANGVIQRSEDRVRLDSVPLLGQLFRQGYGASDFTPGTRVGTVYGDDRKLVVELDITIPRISFNQVVVLNQGSSFHLGAKVESEETAGQGPPGLASIPMLSQLFRGSAYTKAETELIIIITPSLVAPTSE